MGEEIFILCIGTVIVIMAWSSKYGPISLKGLSFPGRVLYTLACFGGLASIAGFAIGFFRPEGGGPLMLLSAAGFFVSAAIAFKLHGLVLHQN